MTKRILAVLLLTAMLLSGIPVPASAATGSSVAVSGSVSLSLSKPYTNVIRLKIHNSQTYTVETVSVYVIEAGTKITWPAGYTYCAEEWHMLDSDGVYYLNTGGVGFMPWLSDTPNAAVTFTISDSEDILELTTISSTAWENDISGADSIGSTHFILKSTYDALYANKSNLLQKGQKDGLGEPAEFTYTSIFTDENASYHYYYDEAWFLKNPTAYNHDLAKMSLRVAMAAAQTTKSNIEALFEDLEFETINCVYPVPTKNTIGYTIASKEIIDTSGKSYQLIAVALRGGDYKAEWSNNFLVGTGTEHKGFSDAADKVVSAVKAHMKKLGTGNNFKIWITGYSRGAATSNLAAHQLNLDAKYNLSYLSESDIFAYCFECPAGVTGAEETFSQVADKNIFNIVNPIDAVPMVAPLEWGFQRYGVTYYLPSSELNYKNYKTAFAAMKTAYKSIAAEAGAASKVANVTKTIKAQHSILRNLIDTIAQTVGNTKNYTKYFQSKISSAVNSCTNDKPDVGDVMLAILGLNILRTPPIVAAAALVVDDIVLITYAHYPELCLAWMEAITDADMNRSTYTRYLKVNYPVNVSVYDSEGVLVAQIIDDVPQEIEGSTIDTVVDENGQKTIVLPFDEEFEIVTTATDDGEMSYQIEEFDLAAAQTLRVINYYDIAIQTGDELTGTAGSSTEALAEYTLESVAGHELTPTADQSGSDIVHYRVDLHPDGNGSVFGGGNFVIGEFAALSAEPKEEEAFLGWYAGGQLISEAPEYRFRVEEDTQITGKFTRNVTACYRISGKGRCETAYGVADELKTALGISKFDSIIIANGDNFADALAGSYLSAAKCAPILLHRTGYAEKNLAYILNSLNEGGTVYILGGTAAVPQSLEDLLTEAGITVARLRGANRFETNLRILEEAGVSDGDEILVCTGTNFADSLSASATGRPILLVSNESGRLTDNQIAFLDSLENETFTVIGGTGAVSANLEALLAEHGQVTRLSGKDRFLTSVLVAQRYFDAPDSAVLAYAWNYPDGLCGGALAYAMNAPLVLTMTDCETRGAASYVQEGQITTGITLGGTGLISDDCVRNIFLLDSSAAIERK